MKFKFRYIPESFLVSYKKDNPELKQTFAQYVVNTPRLNRLGSNVRQRVHCLDAMYVQGVVLKNNASYGGSLGKK